MSVTKDVPNRILYTMIRVSDLATSIAFYDAALGMKAVRRETFVDGRFTLVFMGYRDNPSAPTIELTYNWDEHEYEHGTRFGHIAVEVADIHAACDRLSDLGIKIVRQPGPMKFAPDETGKFENIAFIDDPDSYRIELIETAAG